MLPKNPETILGYRFEKHGLLMIPYQDFQNFRFRNVFLKIHIPKMDIFHFRNSEKLIKMTSANRKEQKNVSIIFENAPKKVKNFGRGRVLES